MAKELLVPKIARQLLLPPRIAPTFQARQFQQQNLIKPLLKQRNRA